MRRDEREAVERAVRRVTEQAASADAIVDEAIAAGLDGSNLVTVQLKQPRAELLSVKADLWHGRARNVLPVMISLARMQRFEGSSASLYREGGTRQFARGHGP